MQDSLSTSNDTIVAKFYSGSPLPAIDTAKIDPDSYFSHFYRPDTIATVSASTVAEIDLYKGHLLKPQHLNPISRNNVSPGWLFPILILILAVFAWLRVYYNKYFAQLVTAFFNNNLTNQIVRDENVLVQRASVYLSFVFNLIAASLIYLISVHYDWNVAGFGTGFSRFVFFAIIVSAVYTAKFLILKFCGWLFDQDKEMATYIFNIFLINNMLAIALLPVVCLAAYSYYISTGFLINTALVLFGAAFVYRLLRGILIGLNGNTFSPQYLFLYLCTLEIGPLLILIRIVIG